MFACQTKDSPATSSNYHDNYNEYQENPDDQLSKLSVCNSKSNGTSPAIIKSPQVREEFCEETSGELQELLRQANNNNSSYNQSKSSTVQQVPTQMAKLMKQPRKAKLAKQETLDEGSGKGSGDQRCCKSSLLSMLRRKRIIIPLIIISCIAAIYCLPYIEIETRVPARLPRIPFNYQSGPLRASSAKHFKVERLFQEQIRGPESVALDSSGNMYMAIEGGFILYAHLNKSSPIKRAYLEQNTSAQFIIDQSGSATPVDNNRQSVEQSQLIKIAELNGIKQLPYDPKRRVRDGRPNEGGGGGSSWRRECKLDEQVYGANLFSTTPESSSNHATRNRRFVTNVIMSRCSKPLGIRLSPDENYLYVIDTLSGLYRISLKVPERPNSNQRLVTKLVDFRANKSLVLPITQLDLPASLQQQAEQRGQLDDATLQVVQARGHLNVSLLAVDDLVIDYGEGTRGGDIIYMSDASQNWIAVSFLYDMLEGRPSGLILRYDTGSNQLSVLNPTRVEHVRTSAAELADHSSRLYKPYNHTSSEPYYGIGAPHLDENDQFDNRPLYFPNGLELTFDRQALLIADTLNRRIIKHYIRGDRKGTSDHWAWTPNFPDNIRRGHDKTYWIGGCGEDMTGKFDALDWLNSWPMLRKFLLKNIYLIGWFVEALGDYILQSTNVRDYGFALKTGQSVGESFCPGMMLLQYNTHGDIIRSIYGKEFPNDLAYYSQVNEVMDPNNNERVLYLSSPSYKYVTKLTLPTDFYDLPSSNSNSVI